MLSITKRYDNYPFAHRQPNHAGHCHFIHGHNWSFEFQLCCNMLDDNGFVYDFGALGWLKDWLMQVFDHTLVLNMDDPMLGHLRGKLEDEKLADIRVVPNCGAEGIANYVFGQIKTEIVARTSGRVWLKRVTVFEDDRNSATVTG